MRWPRDTAADNASTSTPNMEQHLSTNTSILFEFKNSSNIYDHALKPNTNKPSNDHLNEQG